MAKKTTKKTAKNSTKVEQIVERQHREIVNQIVEDIETKGFAFVTDWVAGLANHNPITNTTYRGRNRFHLAYSARKNGYKDPRWFTPKEIRDLGYTIKDGEKYTLIEFWKTIAIRNDEDEVTASFPRLVAFHKVFNAEQLEGVPELGKITRRVNIDSIADSFTKDWVCPITEELAHDGAYYVPSSDRISLPDRRLFKSPEGFARTLFHEMGHSTGHKDRLNRKVQNAFGTKDYAFEELVAELTALFTCIDFGIGLYGDTVGVSGLVEKGLYQHHAAYLQSWCRLLKDKPSALFTAATAANNASDYIRKYHEEHHGKKSKKKGKKATKVA